MKILKLLQNLYVLFNKQKVKDRIVKVWGEVVSSTLS